MVMQPDDHIKATQDKAKIFACLIYSFAQEYAGERVKENGKTKRKGVAIRLCEGYKIRDSGGKIYTDSTERLLINGCCMNASNVFTNDLKLTVLSSVLANMIISGARIDLEFQIGSGPCTRIAMQATGLDYNKCILTGFTIKDLPNYASAQIVSGIYKLHKDIALQIGCPPKVFV